MAQPPPPQQEEWKQIKRLQQTQMDEIKESRQFDFEIGTGMIPCYITVMGWTSKH